MRLPKRPGKKAISLPEPPIPGYREQCARFEIQIQAVSSSKWQVRLGRGSAHSSEQGIKITTQFEALIDSGATNCLFHSDVAAAIGIKDFKSGIVSQTGGVVSGSTMDLYAHDIRLHIGADNLKITGYFSDQLPLPCLLGRSGFFENYIVTFDPTETNPGFELTRVLRA